MAENVEESATKRRRRSRRANSLGLTGDPAVPPATLPRSGQVLAEKYRIDNVIGRGGMGAVYTATHLVSDKRVAVKWMLPAPGQAVELAERFIREARATARIEHPNVVDIYDVGVHAGSVYLVMELLQGETLADRLDRAPVTPTEAVGLLMPALRAVAAAHAQGVIHRDLKPDNIFLCTSKDGELREVKVLDFGISKIAADDRRDLAMTASGTVMGTPYYMSPEQIRGLNQVDRRGDVYAFGVILYEMLGDCYPFDADTYNALILKIATTDPVPLQFVNRELAPELVQVVMRAMARDIEQRFQSVEELAHALEPFAGGITFRMSHTPQGGSFPVSASMRAGPPAAEQTAARGRSRSRRKLAALAAFAVVLLVSAVLWASRNARELAVTEAAVSPAAHEVEPAPPAAPQPAVANTAPAALASDPAGAGDAEEQLTPRAGVEPAPATEPQSSRTLGREPAVAEPTERPNARRRRVRAQAPEVETPVAVGDARPTLPSDWDERLLKVPGPEPRSAPRTAPNTSAGQLSADDL